METLDLVEIFYTFFGVFLAGVLVFEVLLIARVKQGRPLELLLALSLAAILTAVYWPETPGYGRLHPALYMAFLVGTPILSIVGLNQVLANVKAPTRYLGAALLAFPLTLGWFLIALFAGCAYYSNC